MNEYVDQSASGLNLCVYDGIPDLSRGAVRLFREESATFPGGIYVHLGIIGASHIFALSLGETFEMMEMLACTEPAAFDGHVLSVPLAMLARGRRKHPLVLSFPGLEYSFRGWIHNASEGTLERVAQLKSRMREGQNGDGSIALSYDFSGHGNGSGAHPFPPETLVYFSWVKKGPALLATVHTYPNEGKIVYTRSTFNVWNVKKHSSRA